MKERFPSTSSVIHLTKMARSSHFKISGGSFSPALAMLADPLSSLIATLHKSDATPLARYTLAEEIVSRTTAKNNSTVHSRSALPNPPSYRATSPGPTMHFGNDQTYFETHHPDPLESSFHPAPEIVIPQPVSEDVVPPRIFASGPPTISSTGATISLPSCFNGIHPNRGCGGESVKLYGGLFSPVVDYYVNFGELEPTPFHYRNPYLLEGVVPTRGKAGKVSVSLVTKDGIQVYPERRLFTYVDYGRKDM